MHCETIVAAILLQWVTMAPKFKVEASLVSLHDKFNGPLQLFLLDILEYVTLESILIGTDCNI